MIGNITIGADPELFIINEKTRKVISAVGLIPGEKGNPYKSDDMPNGFGLETDNILAEFNIPPVKTREEFINSIEYMKMYIDKFVKNINPDLGILCAASKLVNKDQLQSDQAKEFGCSIDYNAYTEKPNPKPEGNSTRLRVCGFHIHVGYDNPNVDDSLNLIKILDLFLGVPFVLKDTDTRRRTLYGKAGCFRLCSYGFEYRTLSGAVMKDTDTLTFIWNQLIKAIDAYSSGFKVTMPDNIIKAINNSDIDLAKYIISKYKVC